MQDSVIINQISYNLEEVLQDCWHRLLNGAIIPKHPFHTASIASIHNGLPEMRTVVLRKVLPPQKTLLFYTDYRSPKLDQIKLNNNISWLFYDAKSKLQIRLKTEATIHHQEEMTWKRWLDAKPVSRKCYLVQPAPSTKVNYPMDGLPDELQQLPLTEESLLPGYENFAVISNRVTEIDWLLLQHSGHRRAQFILREKEWAMNWVIP